jgi:tetratricopeptide (TPR) repeat protein
LNELQEIDMRDTSAFTACTLFAFVACAAPGVAFSQGVSDCGNPFQNAYGPFDYRTATPGQRSIVEQHHFTPNIEALQSGNSGTIGNELDYTLRAFPNHPRALAAMVRLGQKEKIRKPHGAQFTVECYLERATQFRPDDPNVQLVRGIYYTLQRKYELAINEFNAAIQQAPDNANAHYNLGLAYFENKQYAQATEQAKIAKTLGFPLDGLKNMLKSAGQWRE